MVEFALVLPVLILIVCGIIDFGWLFYNQLSLDNACREGARFAVVNSTRDDFDEAVELRVENSASSIFNNGLEVNVSFSDEDEPTDGDVTVEVKTVMNILTPVLGTINGSQQRELVSRVTMKVES